MIQPIRHVFLLLRAHIVTFFRLTFHGKGWRNYTKARYLFIRLRSIKKQRSSIIKRSSNNNGRSLVNRRSIVFTDSYTCNTMN